jgi:hypothetical protein
VSPEKKICIAFGELIRYFKLFYHIIKKIKTGVKVGTNYFGREGKKEVMKARYPWLMPVILATREAGISRTEI